MGLLDNFDYEKLSVNPLFHMGLGMLANSQRPTGSSAMSAIGRGGMEGMQNLSHAQNAQMRQKMGQMQMDELMKAQKQKEMMQALAKQSVLSPEQQAIGKFGPTAEGAAAIGQFKPSFDTEGFLSGMMGIDPLQAMSMRQSMQKAPIKLGEGEQLLDPSTFKPLAQGSPKADSVPSAIKEYQFAQNQGFKGTFQDFVIQQKRAGAGVTNILNDNLGLKPKDRFEMEDKLRGDYSKATDLDQKILGTSQKMKAVLSGDPNAMKDQAAIYSFAKLLDPDGAVREADYAAITNTAGLADRMKNYVNKLATGQMLTPTQRTEMENILKQWEGVAKKRIAGQQKSFSGRAKMYNLQPENVFQVQRDVVKTGTLNGRKVVQYSDGSTEYAD